ncbi:MAG: hypothetical protein NVS9B4_00320 [Candidatus Acidiferrum sp.]
MQRGAYVKINNSLNRPTSKLGVDYRVLMACAFVSILAFLFVSKIFACLLMPALLGGGASITRRDPQYLRLALLSFRMAAHYDVR